MEEKTVAIVGASADRSKFGNKAVRAFLQAGWTVYPVHPSLKEIEGLETFASLPEAPQPLRRISMYVPPAVGIKLLVEIAAMPHEELFFNPGSEDDDLIAEAERLELEPIQACSIRNIGLSPDMFPDE